MHLHEIYRFNIFALNIPPTVFSILNKVHTQQKEQTPDILASVLTRLI